MGASDLATGALDELLAAAPRDVEALQSCLDAEFEALRERRIDDFEALQPRKIDLLERLALASQYARSRAPTPVVWQQLEDALIKSRDAHLRNAQLLRRQLDAVRATLQTLQGEPPSSGVYDRLGQMAYGRLRGGYQSA